MTGLHGSTAADVLTRIGNDVGRSLYATLELSDRCNEVCAHCYQEQGRKGELTTADWKRIMDGLADAGVLMLTLSGGEVTLRKDFLELVGYARQLGFAVRIFTNGLTMTRELAQQLAEHSVMDVEISVYSVREQTHDFVTGVPGSFAKTVQGVRYLREYGVGVMIKTVVMSVNEAELGEYPAFAQSLGARFRLDLGGVVPREGFDRSPQAFEPSSEKLRELSAIASSESVSAAPQPEPEPAAQSGRQSPKAMLCGAAHNFVIEPNGALHPCSLLDVPLGDLREAAPMQALGSSVASEMRALRWGDLRGCRVCDLARACSHCHAVALAERGEALGPYPSACKKAQERLSSARGSHQPPLRFLGVDRQHASLGPFREVADGVFEAFEDPATAEDQALAERLGWVRRGEGGNPAPALAVRPGELVQIRRPGSKASKTVRVPNGYPNGSQPAVDSDQRSDRGSGSSTHSALARTAGTTLEANVRRSH